MTDSDSSISSTDSNKSSGDSLSASSLECNDGVKDTLLKSLSLLYQDRYQEEQRKIPKTGDNMEKLLTVYKAGFPNIFRSFVRMSPACFDTLVNSIKDHPVFHNNSNNPQMPIEEQVAIALFRFAHHGNAASVLKVALWAGVGYGTACLVTLRVMTAICDRQFCHATMPWLGPAEIEDAKAWVEEHSCPAWHDGWLMVDGTLIPLYQCPHHHGNAFFDQKSNYSLNLQVSAYIYFKSSLT